MTMHVLVTGANGFVGSHLCRALLDKSYQVSGAVRNPESLIQGVQPRKIESIGPKTDWTDALFTVDAVVHLAARVHVMEETAANPLAKFRHVNTKGTLHLAEEAAQAGVKRLVFMSTVKVNGESTNGIPFNEDQNPNPQDPYAISKWEAEEGLREISRKTGMEVVILRPPLVYGAGVKGNFESLMSLCAKGIPLPLKSVDNRRSLVYVKNLVDAVIACLNHPDAAGKTYMVRDSEEVSTAELVQKICTAMGKEPKLVGMPPGMLTLAGKLTGKSKVVGRLLGSLSVDDSTIRRELSWQPPYSMDQALQETVSS